MNEQNKQLLDNAMTVLERLAGGRDAVEYLKEVFSETAPPKTLWDAVTNATIALSVQCLRGMTSNDLNAMREAMRNARFVEHDSPLLDDLTAEGINLIDYTIWHGSKNHDDWWSERTKTASNELPLTIADLNRANVDRCIELKHSGKLASILREYEQFNRGRVAVSKAVVKPTPNTYVVSSDHEFLRRIFDTRAALSDRVVRREKLNATKTSDGRKLKACTIDYAVYGVKDLLNFDVDVAMTIAEMITTQPQDENGGWPFTFAQLYRSYFKVPKGTKIEPDGAGINLLKASVSRLRSSGFSYLDLEDAINKGRLDDSLMAKTKEDQPFLDVILGSVTVMYGGKPVFTDGGIVKRMPILYRLGDSLRRLRRVSGAMRLPKMTRSEEIEQRYVFILSRLLIGIDGATIPPIPMIDRWSKVPDGNGDYPREQIGVLRDEHDEFSPLTPDKKKKANKWVLQLLEHWQNIGACNYSVEYEVCRGKTTKNIRSFTLTNVNKSVVLEHEILSIK